jgi:hypothetical protein
MTAIDVRHVTQRRALESLVDRCMDSEDTLWLCLTVLTPDYFARDYDLRIAFYALVGRLARGAYDPAKNRDDLVDGFAALDMRDDDTLDRASARWHWYTVLDDWYDPCTVVMDYVNTLLQGLSDMHEIETTTALVYRDHFAHAPLAVDEWFEDAVWDRIREAVLARRSLRFAKAVPPIPRQHGDKDWEGILARAYP